MTVKLLMDWPDSRNGKNYLAGNLLTTDAGTESGLVAAKMATSTLTGGTAYVPPVVQKQRRPVEAEFDEVTGVIEIPAGVEKVALLGAVVPHSLPKLVVANARDAGAAIYWRHPKGWIPDSYKITNNVSGVVTSVSANGSKPTNSLIVSGLTNGTPYTFTVQPVTNDVAGVGVVTNSVTPTALPVPTVSADVAYWFAARKLAGPPANGAAVATLTDFSGAARHAPLAAGGTAATFNNSWNTKSALTFANSYYTLPFANDSLSEQLSMIIVADYTGGTSNDARIIDNMTVSGDQYNWGLDTFASGSQGFRMIMQGGMANSSANISGSTPYIVSITMPGKEYVNGTKSTGDIGGATANAEKINIGGLLTKTSATWSKAFPGRIAEIIVFRGVLSQAERWAWEAYLAGQYGMAAPAQQ